MVNSAHFLTRTPSFCYKLKLPCVLLEKERVLMLFSNKNATWPSTVAMWYLYVYLKQFYNCVEAPYGWWGLGGGRVHFMYLPVVERGKEHLLFLFFSSYDFLMMNLQKNNPTLLHNYRIICIIMHVLLQHAILNANVFRYWPNKVAYKIIPAAVWLGIWLQFACQVNRRLSWY